MPWPWTRSGGAAVVGPSVALELAGANHLSGRADGPGPAGGMRDRGGTALRLFSVRTGTLRKAPKCQPRLGRRSKDSGRALSSTGVRPGITSPSSAVKKHLEWIGYGPPSVSNATTMPLACGLMPHQLMEPHRPSSPPSSDPAVRFLPAVQRDLPGIR